MQEILIENQNFIAKEKYQDKFKGSCALGISWRPGQEEKSYEIKNCIIDGAGSSEGLKMSFCYNVHVESCKIYGGVEDCVDIVRGGNITFANCSFISNNTKQHITIKGGAKNIRIINCNFIKPYKSRFNGACIDLGNWTDYDDVNRPRVRNVEIKNCRIIDSRRSILCRVLYSDDPTLDLSFGKVFKVPRFLLAIFWLGQRLGVLGKRRRFTKDLLEIYDIEL